VELHAVSETEFVDRYLGLEIEFKVDAAGSVTEAEVALPGEGLVAMRYEGHVEPDPMASSSMSTSFDALPAS
jgi:hypothetical protein